MNLLKMYKHDEDDNLVECGSLYIVFERLGGVGVDKYAIIIKHAQSKQVKTVHLTQLAFNTYESIIYERITDMASLDAIDSLVLSAFNINGVNVLALELLDVIFSTRVKNKILTNPDIGIRKNWQWWELERDAYHLHNEILSHELKNHKKANILIYRKEFADKFSSRYLKILERNNTIIHSDIDIHGKYTHSIAICISEIDTTVCDIYKLDAESCKCENQYLIKDVLSSLVYRLKCQNSDILKNALKVPHFRMSRESAMLLAIKLKDLIIGEFYARDYNDIDTPQREIEFNKIGREYDGYKLLVQREKLSGRYGSKGVISKITRDDLMPRIADTNEVVDLIMNGSLLLEATHNAAKVSTETENKENDICREAEPDIIKELRQKAINAIGVPPSYFNSQQNFDMAQAYDLKYILDLQEGFMKKFEEAYSINAIKERQRIKKDGSDIKKCLVLVCGGASYEQLTKAKRICYDIVGAPNFDIIFCEHLPIDHVSIADDELRLIKESDYIYIMQSAKGDINHATYADVVKQILEYATLHSSKKTRIFTSDLIIPRISIDIQATMLNESMLNTFNSDFRPGERYNICIYPFGMFLAFQNFRNWDLASYAYSLEPVTLNEFCEDFKLVSGDGEEI